MNDYERGRIDAKTFCEVWTYYGGAWIGRLRSGSTAWLVNPVNDRYLAGLAAGGCRVIEPRAALQRAA